MSKQDDLHQGEHYERPKPVIMKGMNATTASLKSLDCDSLGILTVRPIDEQVQSTLADADTERTGTGVMGDSATQVKNGTDGVLLLFDGAAVDPLWSLAPGETVTVRTATELVLQSVGSSIIGAVNLVTGGVVSLAGAITGATFLLSRAL